MDTPYYIFYADEFIKNYHELENAFRNIYPYYQIAYSFKTNYVPAVCQIVKQLGGYAEVVSDMEYTLAKRVGFPDKKIIYNGPGKGIVATECLLNSGHLHIDNGGDIKRVLSIARKNRNKQFKVGVRVNFDIDNGLHSRFGFDIDNGDFKNVIDILNAENNVAASGLHFHISRARGLRDWKKRIDKVLEISDDLFDYILDYIDIGSGMFGHLDQVLLEQFGNPPSYTDYAEVVGGTIADHYKGHNNKPWLFTEPGTTLVSKYFHLFTTVLDIKEIRRKYFALLDSSFQNVGEICRLKKVPMINQGGGSKQRYYDSIDFVGYTCLEQDVIYRGYSGKLAIGDKLEIQNVGGYSIVEKPPFIHPDIPIYMLINGKMSCIKRAQTFDDIFLPYVFDIKEETQWIQ